MFHTYVRNARGSQISLERPERLMDSRIVHRVLVEDGLLPREVIPGFLQPLPSQA